MKKCILYWRGNDFWSKGTVVIDGAIVARINKFYEATPEWILIFDCFGGSGYGYSKGDLIEKIFIGDCEFKIEPGDAPQDIKDWQT